MISAHEEEYILRKAYVPEHIVSLMCLISSGEPFLIDDYLYFVKKRLLMFIGFPLGKEFDENKFNKALTSAVERFCSDEIRFIAPNTPRNYISSCVNRQSDHYYRLDLSTYEIRKDLTRVCERASEVLLVEKDSSFSSEHNNLIQEFIERVDPGDQVKALYRSMEGYVSSSESSHVLNARDMNGNLSAFYIVDTAATEFITYLIGCHSKRHYVSHASDLLMSETIRLCRDYNKSYIHLGLGVNKGIRKFKEKWGGYPFMSYEYCERARGNILKRGFIDYLRSRR